MQKDEHPAYAQRPPETPSKGNARGSGYERQGDDWYIESRRAVEALLKVESFAGEVWDPACGGGNIPAVCLRHGLNASGSDLRERGYGRTGVDFLKSERQVDCIISNPPFGIAQQFVQHALRLARWKVAIVARLAFLEGQDRYRELYSVHPPARLWVFPWRESMPPGGVDVPRRNGSTAYAWFVWETRLRTATNLGWLT